ncbi:MAG: hypothetical protein ABIO29_00930 [Sphingomicrobium sp.]
MDHKMLMTLLPFAVLALVFALRFRSMNKERPLDLKRIWILPGVLIVLAAMTLSAMPPDTTTLMWAALALAVGAVIGWYRGKTIAIHHDPQTGQLTQKPSLIGFLLVVVLVGLKFGARSLFGIDPAAATGATPDPAAAMFTDILLAFAIGLLVATQAEVTLRAKRLMAAR